MRASLIPQDGDGIPHYAYSDQESGLRFVWDGRSEHIQVCTDERIIDEIPAQVAALAIDTAEGWVRWFLTVCKAYIVIKRNV